MRDRGDWQPGTVISILSLRSTTTYYVPVFKVANEYNKISEVLAHRRGPAGVVASLPLQMKELRIEDYTYSYSIYGTSNN